MKKVLPCLLVLSVLLALAFGSVSSTLGSEPVSSQKTDDPTTYREQKIYLPYDNLKEVLQKKEKGIFIPYSDFVKLWEEATRKPPEKLLPPPPIDAAVIHAAYQGTVHGEMAEFHAELRISALKERWGKLLLNFKDIALTSVFLDGKTPFLKAVPEGLELLLPEKGSYVLEIGFSASVQSIPGKRFIRFQLPSAPLTRIHMTIPGEDLDVKIAPMLSKRSAVINGNTELHAFLPPEGAVDISWLAKSIETKTEKSLLFANLFSELHIRESVNTFNTQIDFSIMQAKTDTFRIKIPESLGLVRVDGKDIRDWELGNDGILTVNLHEKIDGRYLLSVMTEAYRNLDDVVFDFPQFEVVDAKREEGIIAIRTDPSLRVQIDKRDRVTQIDPGEIGSKTTLDDLVSAFRYVRRPYLVRLAISKVEPRITVFQNILVSIGETMIDYNSQVHFTVRDAGVFEFKFLMPDGFRVAEVGTEGTVDSFSVARENGRDTLKVLVKHKVYGDYRLPVHLEADKEDKNLSFSLPKLVCLGVEKEDGIIAIALQKNLKLSTVDIKSLRPVSLEELQTPRIQNQERNNILAAGYRYATTDYSAILDIEKRKTKVMARVERNIDLQEAVIKITDLVRYQILYAPVSQLQLELPISVGRDAVITGDNIKEKRFIIDEKEQKGVWLIELHAPQLNQYTLSVSLERKLPELKIGEQRKVEVPAVRILEVFDESGYISVSKSPDLQIDASEDNLEPLDPKELPSTMDRGQSVLAFKYLAHPYALVLESTRHRFERVLDAIVNEAHFDIVISREGVVKTEGIFRLQNTNRQSLEIQMPRGTGEIYGVSISGRKASVSRGSSERSKVIMLGKNIEPGREITVRMIYETRPGKNFGMLGALRVESAEIMDIPTSKITWRLYLPDRYSYLYMKGSMDPQRRSLPTFKTVNPSLYSQKVRRRSRIVIDQENLPRQDDEDALYTHDVDLVREGRLYTLSKLDKGAFVDIYYLDKSALFKVSLFFVAVIALIFTYIPYRVKLNKIKLFTASGIVAFFIRASVPQGFKHFASLLLFGIGISAVVLLCLYLYRQVQSRRGNQKEEE
jgi:hypothetical protein